MAKKEPESTPTEEREAAGEQSAETAVAELSQEDKDRERDRLQAAETFKDFMLAGRVAGEVDVKISRRGPRKQINKAGRLVSVDVGYCDTVPLELLRPVAEEMIAQLWGGGVYTVQGIYEGQGLRAYTVKIGGKSRAIEREGDEDAAAPAVVDPFAQLRQAAEVVKLISPAQSAPPVSLAEQLDALERLKSLTSDDDDDDEEPTEDAETEEVKKALAGQAKGETDVDGWVKIGLGLLELVKAFTGKTPATREEAAREVLTNYMNGKVTTAQIVESLKKHAGEDELDYLAGLNPAKAPKILAKKFKLTDEVREWLEGAAGQRKLRELQKALES